MYNMKTQKNLGVWMDHSTANLIDLDSTKKTESIVSNFTTNTKEDALNKSESLMHNKRQQMNEAYYREIADKILKYNSVLLFGPTNANVELHNYLSKDLHFKNIDITLASADKMTDNQQVAFVKKHFEHS
ncbi:MAG: stalled ribosome rescue protein Dom34 [Polaribacter sp.]|jgi:stalled ribosome rescue protein Dom34